MLHLHLMTFSYLFLPRPELQILYRTVSINVLKGDDVEQSVEEVVPYRQYTVQVCLQSLLWSKHASSDEAHLPYQNTRLRH